MIISHKGIYYDRYDTPFGIGALICAISCNNHCRGCFHQDRNDPIIQEEAESIISKVLSNPFVNGIILGYLEWLDGQYEEALELIKLAQNNNLQVILYTHCTYDDIVKKYSKLLLCKGIYIKLGAYDDTRLISNYTSYNVPLASSNQYIIRVE